MRLSFVGGVASDTLRAPVHVRLSLVPEMFSGTSDDSYDVESNRWCLASGDDAYGDDAYDDTCSKKKAASYTFECEGDGGVEWPSDLAWTEAERMLSVTTTTCLLALSAAWCLMLLTALGGVLGARNILSVY